MLRIVQISDCHLPGDRAQRYRGRDAYASIERLLPVIKRFGPDVVLATGDLSEDGSDVSYRWLASQLRGLEVPVLAIPGNHDCARTLRRHFDHAPVELPQTFDVGGWRIVLMDSAPAGQIAGSFSQQALQELETSLQASAGPVLVALHHQPMLVASPWIDRYPLRQAEAFWQCLGRCQRVKAVVWGHIHQAVDREVDGIQAMGAPSTVSNSLPGQPRFSDDGLGGACRWLKLAHSGAIETGLLTLADGL